MKMILVLLTMMTAIPSYAQYAYDVSKDKENGATVYKGMITFGDLKQQTEFSWLDEGARNYKPDSNSIKFLQKNISDYNITVFMGTWCSDSHDLIPKLYKVLQVTGYPMANYLMYGTDRAKTSKGGEEKLYDITKVPTIIVYKNNREVGRITEMVAKSIENDLQAIIEKHRQKR